MLVAHGKKLRAESEPALAGSQTDEPACKRISELTFGTVSRGAGALTHGRFF